MGPLDRTSEVHTLVEQSYRSGLGKRARDRQTRHLVLLARNKSVPQLLKELFGFPCRAVADLVDPVQRKVLAHLERVLSGKYRPSMAFERPTPSARLSKVTR